MNDLNKFRVKRMSFLYSTLLFIAERSSLTFNLSTGSVLGLTQYVQINARSGDSTSRLVAKVDLDSDREVQDLVVSLFAQFLPEARAATVPGALWPAEATVSFMSSPGL